MASNKRTDNLQHPPQANVAGRASTSSEVLCDVPTGAELTKWAENVLVLRASVSGPHLLPRLHGAGLEPALALVRVAVALEMREAGGGG